MNGRVASARALSLGTKRAVSDYLGNRALPEGTDVAIDPRRLDPATAELTALIAEARGHRVRPEPDAIRFGALHRDRRRRTDRAQAPRIGIVVNPRRRYQVSDRVALHGFVAAAEQRGIRAVLTTRPAVVERFDAYLIREDTSPVGGAVYRFVHAAERAGCSSIDDFHSLIRCGNKAYQAVLFERRLIPVPATLLWFRGARCPDVDALGYPLVVKHPEGAFSRDVHRCATAAALTATAARLFRRSPVLVVQEFVPSDFDWRIGICNGVPIFAVKYRYPAGSWKIADYDARGRQIFGAAEPVALENVPPMVMEVALAAAAAIGTGLYGVDVKATANGAVVLEVNDNPDIDHAVEAAVAPDRVYGTIIETLARRAQGGRRT